MHFCPTCANMLQLESRDGNMHFVCPTCSYLYRLKAKVSTDVLLSRKEVDDVLGGAEAWKNADQTDASCPRCSHHRAYYQQLQIRSADEPMTTFYKCVDCGFRWRED
uniref:DNA-directed RNA polymerase subunit n=1 Tax=Calcidiscus leptoporus TaxID=127549 RepID=A0A6U5GW28_9EUKA|mmetsp:Transcript_31631/g.73652  ORF Transcript_31631/g.73652 Transcript_31631/m.73652 type:complete len:107 (+) Transcript_31631:60-380(+)